MRTSAPREADRVDHPSSRILRAVLLAAVLGTALAYMSDNMLNLAVPSVARDLGATVTDVQWILNTYYVALGSGALVAGSMGDIVGHRWVCVGGLLLFSAGAVGCAVAPTVGMLVLSRFLQGLGAAMLLTAGLALVTRLNSSEDRGSAVGQFPWTGGGHMFIVGTQNAWDLLLGGGSTSRSDPWPERDVVVVTYGNSGGGS